MALKGLTTVIGILFFIAGIAVAENEIGIYGFRGTTNYEMLKQPLGVGAFLQLGQSRSVAIRLSFSWGKDSDKFMSTIDRGSGFSPERDTIRDLWEQDAFINVFELSVLMTLIRNQNLSLEVGPGIGFATHERNVVGSSTGFEWGGDSGIRPVRSVLSEFRIEHSRLKPVIVHLFLRDRISSGQSACVDCSILFGDQVHSTETGLAVGFRL